MDAKEENLLAVPEHNWVFDPYAEFFYCLDCQIEVTKYLFELEEDDYPKVSAEKLLDHIVDVECE